MSEALDATVRRTVGVRDIPLVWVAPRRLFSRVEDVPAWGWPLLILLAVVTLIGYATVETGLIDLTVDRRVDRRIAQLASEPRDVTERSALREMIEQQRKRGEFERMLTRIQVVVAEPGRALAYALLLAAMLYGVVALTGRKPEWHTLLTICVYAAFIDVLRLLMRLVLMLQHGTLEVDTSPALLTRFMVGAEGPDPTSLAALSGLLTAADPFRVWFWLVVIIGLSATAQLRGWRAWVVCSLCWLGSAGVRCGLAAATVASATGAPGQA